jgi:hypothetical protein
VLSAVLGDTAAVAAGMAVFGAAEAVTGITLTALIQHVAPHGARTESYSVIISAALTASSGGRLAFAAAAGGEAVGPAGRRIRPDYLLMSRVPAGLASE